MKQLRLCLGVVLGFCLALPAGLAALDVADLPPLIISEIKIKNDTSGFDEFIELHNISDANVSLADFNLEYFNSPSPIDGQQPVKAVVADGLLEPDKTIVLAKNETQIQNSRKSPFSSLSDSGGQIRLTDTDGNIYEQISWSSTNSLAIAPVLYLPSTASTKSFQRGYNEDSSPITDDPTWTLATPSPTSFSLLPAPVPEPEPEPEVEQIPPAVEITEEAPGDTQTTPGAEPVADELVGGILPLQITELLPNPASPATDAADEYIELYNPNEEAVDLNGYKLQTGNTYSYSHTFEEGTLQPHEYRAFYVTETDTLLANSGGRARLLGASGQIIFETTPYEEAGEGLAWALLSGPLSSEWQWTTTPSPNGANVLAVPVLKAAAASKTTTKKASTKAAATTKPKAAAKPKATKTGQTAASGSDDSEEVNITPLHPTVIAGIGILALGYAAYEYRHDFRNRLYQLRRYRATRRAARQVA